MLVRGVAAARTRQARDKEEARFICEWVLRSSDAESDQKTTAWLWLSEVEEDHRKKRDCLENVITFDPANGPARRGLALLDGRLKAEDIIDPDQRSRRWHPTSLLRRPACAATLVPSAAGACRTMRPSAR